MTKSLTLLELIISIAIISLVVLGFTSLDLYSRHNVLLASRRAKVQNTVSYVLDHMAKEIGKAIGDSGHPAVNTTDIDGNDAIRVRIDSNKNGQWDAYPDDIQIAYVYDSGSHEFWYCPNCTDDSACLSCNPQWGDDDDYILAKNIVDFSTSPQDNYVIVNLTGRWDADQPVSQDNPEMEMQTGIKMYGVSY